jgi:protease-4
MFSSFREPTDEERQKEQALLDAFYDRFVELVAEARSMPEERVRELATGEIFTATQAQEHGLIDDLGDLDAAIDLAQSLAGLAERKVTYIRPHRGLRDRLLNGVSASLAESMLWSLETRLRERRIE